MTKADKTDESATKQDTQTPPQPKRILQYTNDINMGGVTMYIMNLYRQIDRTKIQFDFLCYNKKSNFFDDEICELGGRVFCINRPKLGRTYKFKKEFNALLDAHPEWKTIHLQKRGREALCLKYAKKRGLRTIAHGHGLSRKGIIRKTFSALMRRQIRKHAQIKLACSKEAGEYLYGKNARFTIAYNGIDTEKFVFSQSARDSMRNELKLCDKNFTIISVGNFFAIKNTLFLIDIFAEILNQNGNARLVLVGEGDMRQEIEAKIAQLGLGDSICLLGRRQDITRLLSGADVFVLPSISEGFGIALIEAQANGLPCVASTGVPAEVAVTNLVEFIELERPAKEWADILLAKKPESRELYNKIVKESYCDINKTTEKMQELYLQN